jgi:hypothetical protein
MLDLAPLNGNSANVAVLTPMQAVSGGGLAQNRLRLE